AEKQSFADGFLLAHKEAAMVAAGSQTGEVAGLVLVLIAEDERASRLRIRTLISRHLSLGQIERTERIQGAGRGHEPQSRRRLGREWRSEQPDKVRSGLRPGDIPKEG